MPAPLLTTLDKQNEAINLLAYEQNDSEAARQLGVSPNTIGRFKGKHQIEIQAQAERYLSILPSLVDQDIEEFTKSKALSKTLVQYLEDGSKLFIDSDGKEIELFPVKEAAAIQKFLEYTDKKVTDIKRSVGMLNSHTPAMVFQTMNIYNDNRQTISNTVLNALTNNARSSTELPSDIVIDVDSQVD